MKYYYLTDSGNMLIEECIENKSRGVMIGSSSCVNDCVCVDYSDKEGWVICNRLIVKLRKLKLDKLDGKNL